MLNKHGSAMMRRSISTEALIELYGRIADLAPSHTRRSEGSQKIQQFSTPLPLAAIVAHAAQIKSSDMVLEPSAALAFLPPMRSWRARSYISLSLNRCTPNLLSFLFRSCPLEWCRSARRLSVSGGLGRIDQAAAVVSLMS